eukprot:COSAG01_NODE_181_length_22873_cov_12.951392_11_plen_123_part_00
MIVGAVALRIQQWRQVAERHPHRRVALCRREPHGAAGVEPDGVVHDEVVSSALAGADGGGVRLRREWKEAARVRGGGGGAITHRSCGQLRRRASIGTGRGKGAGGARIRARVNAWEGGQHRT